MNPSPHNCGSHVTLRLYQQVFKYSSTFSALSPLQSSDQTALCSYAHEEKCISMCHTSLTPAYNSAEGPREVDGAVTVEAEDWSSGALISISNFPVAHETFFTDEKASKTVAAVLLNSLDEC